MDCAKIQKKILLEGVSDPKVTSHLASCAKCAIFADSLEKFTPAKPEEGLLEIPGTLDDVVKSEARRLIAERSPRRPLNLDVRYGDFASYFAMAATVVLVSWLFISLLFPRHTQSRGGEAHLGSGGELKSASSDNTVSLAWTDNAVEEDFFTIDADIEFTFALMNISSDEDLDQSDDSSEDERFDIVIPEILT